MVDRLRTGIEALDRKLGEGEPEPGGGLPAGSIVALTAQPASQAELFLFELTAARGTLYLTLNRNEAAVETSVENSPARTGNPTVRSVDRDAPLDNASRLISALSESTNLIIDPLDVLERTEPARFRSFMEYLQNQVTNTGSLAVLHCLDGRDVPELRDTTEHMVDVIFELRTEIRGERVENKLAVPKFRGGRAPAEVIKLELTDQVTIDTSRDIA